jgi:hypothetical protein
MEIKLDYENNAIHNYTHNLGAARGLNYALDLIVEAMQTNGLANDELEQKYQDGLQQAGNLIAQALKTLNTKLGLDNLSQQVTEKLTKDLAE